MIKEIRTRKEFEELIPPSNAKTRYENREENNSRILLSGAGLSARFCKNLRGKSIIETANEISSIKIDEILGDSYNFEIFLKHLWAARRICENLKVNNPHEKTPEPEYFANKYEIFRRIFIDSIIQNINHSNIIDYKYVLGEFLLRFNNIYTLAYDPIIYWSILYASDGISINNEGIPCAIFGDYFNIGEEGFVTFLPNHDAFNNPQTPKTLINYLHGSILIFEYFAETENDYQQYFDKIVNPKRRKDVLNNEVNIMDIIKRKISTANNSLPCVVSECSSMLKQQQINSNPYLWFCMQNFQKQLNNENTEICIIGFSGSDEDKHINDIILKSKARKVICCCHENKSPLLVRLEDKFKKTGCSSTLYIYDITNEKEHPLPCDDAF